MSTLIYTHPRCTEHDTGYGHPESPARLIHILQALRAAPFPGLQWKEAPLATDVQLMRIHPKEYVERIFAHIPKRGNYALDGDTILSPASGEAARYAAGAVCAAVDAVIAGEGQNAFCAIRPPGHHATPRQAMGFCLFNNVAIGVAHARAVHGLRRVAIVDFDVHHGNGTQACFEKDGDCLYISLHQSHIYPGSGRREERGVGNIVNVPLPAGSRATELRQVWASEIDPALSTFQPEMLFVSAGFDAHSRDPLAGLAFEECDYQWITEQLVAIAQRYSQSRIVSALEGGYHLGALAASVVAHVKALQDGTTA